MSDKLLMNESSISNNMTVYPSEGMRILQIIVIVMIFIVGVSLNGLVVWALGVRVWCRNRGSTRETQSPDSFRIYVVNLALADLVLLLRMPFMLPYLVNHFTWTLGETACKRVIYLPYLGLYASAFFLCTIAVERSLCLLRPVWAEMKRSRWAAPLVCTIIWLLAAYFASPYFHTGRIILWQNRTACIESNMGAGQALIVVETLVGFLLLLVIFLSCNIAVIFCTKKAESAMTSPTSSSGPSNLSQRRTHLYRVLFLTVIIFLTCWLPYITCRLLRAVLHDQPKLKERVISGAYVALFLVYIKTVLTPILYVIATPVKCACFNICHDTGV